MVLDASILLGKKEGTRERNSTMKQIIFILLVGFGNPTVKVDTAYAEIIRTIDPRKTEHVSAVIFYDKEYFKRFMLNWKCGNCELIDLQNKKLLPLKK